MVSELLRRILIAAIALILAAFFAFVGWHKAFSSSEMLAQHGAYTVHLPDWLGRIAGFTEMVCAAALLFGIVPRWSWAAMAGAGYVFCSQILAGAVHIAHDETGALPANVRWMVLAAVLFFLCRWRKSNLLVEGSPT